MKYKTNIFSLFYIIFFVSTIIFSILLYVKYDDIKTTQYEKQKHAVELVTNATHANLLHYEAMLGLLGHQLVEHKVYKNTKESKDIFKQLLALNSEVIGFGLLDVNGDYLVVSSNIDVKKMPNVKNKDESKLSFEETLLSKNMVVGRTFYLEHLKSWVTPMRKAIRNDEGKVIGVMVAGLKVDRNNSFLSNLELAGDKFIVLVKDFNQQNKLYRTYSSPRIDKSNSELYNEPVSLEVYNNINKSLLLTFNFTLEDVRNNTKGVSNTYILNILNNWNKKMFIGLIYDKRYRLFMIVQSDYAIIKNKFFDSILIYTLLFLLSQVIFYVFLRYVKNMDIEQQATLKFQATHDNLTKLPNRQYMYENYHRFVSKEKEFELLYIDLDNFKNINDNFGHPIGDEILKKVAIRLQGYVKEEDMLIRQGGDEFIIIKGLELSGDNSYYEGILELLGKTFHIKNMEFKLGVSIGIAHYPMDTEDLTELLSIGDIAMYEAKKTKNAYCVYSKNLKNAQRKKAEIDQELRNALVLQEISMVYQPQINTDGTLHGVEALVRWKNEKLGQVPPDEFIPIAEESGLILELSRFISSQAASQTAEVQKILNVDFNLSINLSVRQLFSENFIEKLLHDIKVFEGKYNLITFEITEHLFIEDINHVAPLLHDLKKKGFEISLDDFGTGYSSLSLLRTLPISELKIDKSFVDEILEDSSSRVLSASIIKMGQNLSMKTLAEGVESIEQVELLKSQNCDIFQGYYFSKPLTKDELIEFIRNRV